MAQAEKPAHRKFAIISAVYNVAPYLDDFIASIEKQTFGLSQLQVIMVDDGSTDDSLSQLQRWQERKPDLVTVIHKDNGGQGSARNAGLAVASADWVTFTDPDDFVDPKYFETVNRLIGANSDATMVATNRIFYHDGGKGESDTHPLRKMFEHGNEVVDLNKFPEHFHGSAPAAFFRLDIVRQFELVFDERIYPNFEDGLFCCEYLLRVKPIVIFAAEAVYYYRKRVSGNSSLQQGGKDVRRFTVVPRFGYLHILQTAAQLHGQAPEWLQNFILYELSGYFSQEQRAAGSGTAATGKVGDEFLGILAEIWKYIDPETIASYRITQLPVQTRDFWSHGFSGEDWHTPYVVIDRLDKKQRLLRIRFRYLGPEPQHAYFLRGVQVDPAYQKTHTFELFGRGLIREKIAWMSTAGTLRVQIDGHFVPLRSQNQGAQRTSARPSAIDRFFAPKHWSQLWQQPVTLATLRPSDPPRSSQGGLIPWLMVKLNRRKYYRAWVLMDRTFSADDNAERLFEYLRDQRSDINAYFCVEPGTPTYRRMRSGPYRRRIIGYGTSKWRSLMMYCTHMISSHCSPEQMTPVLMRGLRSFDWRFVFLQHGVIKDDISRWLNTKNIDLFVTSTPAEYHSIIDDGPYIFTGKEVKLTGLPRFDRLHKLGEATPPAERNLVLIAPTWREWLTMPLTPGDQRRKLVPGFMDSEFMRQWMALLGSPRLAELARAHGMRLAFLPHPNLRTILTEVSVPDGIEIHSIETEDVQQLFARTGLLITDYSSMAFNTGFLGRPCVYFQFDEERFLGGEHASRPGYFDYRRDGFGPVAATLPEALGFVEEALKYAPDPAPAYRERMDRTFPLRDELACERVVAEIEKI